jgi:predicted DNA-binding transcriptional regulator AlpA
MPKITAERHADDAVGIPRDRAAPRRTRTQRRRLGPPPAPSMLTIDQVLTELQVARSTFDTWRALGTAPECIKLPNGQLRIRRAVFDAWLADHVQAHAEAC